MGWDLQLHGERVTESVREGCEGGVWGEGGL